MVLRGVVVVVVVVVVMMSFLDFLVKLGTGIGIQMVEEDKATVYLLLVSYLRGRCWD